MNIEIKKAILFTLILSAISIWGSLAHAEELPVLNNEIKDSIVTKQAVQKASLASAEGALKLTISDLEPADSEGVN